MTDADLMIARGMLSSVHAIAHRLWSGAHTAAFN